MTQISARRENRSDGGFGFTDAIIGIVLLSLAVILSGSILISAAGAVERAERRLRTDLESRLETFER